MIMANTTDKVILCKWRRCNDGYQLATGLGWVAFIGPSEVGPKPYWWKVHGGKSGHQESLELAKICALGAVLELGDRVYRVTNDIPRDKS